MKKEISVDVMAKGYFVCSLKVPLPENGTLDMESLEQEIFKVKPSLRHEKKLVICLNSEY